MGLMWASGDNTDAMLKTLRDTCEQNDGMQGYGWLYYDTRVGGSQLIHDEKLGIDLTTDFIKSTNGGSWAVGVRGDPKSQSPNAKTSVIFHVAVEEEGRTIVCQRGLKESEATCRGNLVGLGEFEFRVLGDHENKSLHSTVIHSLQVSEDKLWQAKSVFMDEVKASNSRLAVEDKPGTGNMHFIQLTFEGPFTAIFAYNPDGTTVLDRGAVYLGLRDLQSRFTRDLAKVFPPATPFEDGKHDRFTQEALSNLLSGLGFFHGDSKIDNTHAPEYEETEPDFWEKAASAMAKAPITTTEPLTLLSHTPSRPFFPRGFLWDEGFHLLPVIEWDLDLAISVLQSWFSLMDKDGWIAREQILAPEARSKVPKEFQVQYPHYANPPTLLSLAIPSILSKLTGASPYNGHPSIHLKSPKPLLETLYPLLVKHYNWNLPLERPKPFQQPSKRSRRLSKTQPPSPSELHLDALSWVGASASALLQLATYLNLLSDISLYSSHLNTTIQNLDNLHWDTTSKTYCDATYYPKNHTTILTCHEGYITLFPFLLGILPSSHPNIPYLLDSIERLSSPFGIRSLSNLDSGYKMGDNYWRGAIWIHLNRATKLAKELKENLVETVYNSWSRTGFFWEQYDDKTGEGKGSRAFTGWTGASILLIMGLEFGDGHTAGGGDQAELGDQEGKWKGVVTVAIIWGCLLVGASLVGALIGKGVKIWLKSRRRRGNGKCYEPVPREEEEGGFELDERGKTRLD
ncbi:hypothetical protein QBC38DRAFT_496954 [Podospora fimiseda]|uniref:Mannosyl-oligosaccharide glucosidase n=1 Tax=Podospora fimiseda TaxID=252190 RepID=A0AAN7BW05_9PEZI|nr:hypothetical protein QBC38DRAFT_496954 [Podospora fimiseda]